MNILVVCVAGMSSSALVKKMRDYVAVFSLSYKIGTCSSAELQKYSERADIILLAPQLSYSYDTICKEYPAKNIILISPANYGSQNVEEILRMVEIKETTPSQNRRTNRVVGLMMKVSQNIGNNKILRAISDGMISLVPILLIGSLLMLINNFPSLSFLALLEKYEISTFLEYGIDATINCIAIYTCFVVSYNLAKRLGESGFGIGLNALICFFMLIGRTGNNLDAEYFNAKGLFLAIFVAIISTYIFILVKRQLNRTPIKYISENIAESFLAITPILVNCFVFILVSYLFSITRYGNLPTFIETVIQTYLSTLVGNSIISAVLLNFLAQILWFFGIHGGSIVGSISDPIYISLAYANLDAYQKGISIPYMITNQFKYCYIFGGAGSTLSLTILMTFFSKSKQLKKLGKLTLPTGIFFINEGLIFGLPIFLNPVMFLPFIMIPPISGILTYYVMKIGLVPLAIGFQIPWTTPPIISGFIQGGIRLAVWQIVLIILQGFMWYPFFRIIDNKMTVTENRSKLNQ